MVEKIEDMPAGTIGFRAAAALTRDDYPEVREPVLRAAAEAGEIRMLVHLTDFHGLEPSAWFEDLKTGLGLGIGHHSASKRSAVVTAVEGVGNGLRAFA